jgi:hypothetical protein
MLLFVNDYTPTYFSALDFVNSIMEGISVKLSPIIMTNELHTIPVQKALTIS